MRIGWNIDNPPSEKEEYLVQYESGDMDIAEWTNVNPFWPNLTTNWHWTRVSQFDKVVAWQFLPEKFKG